MSFEVYMRKKQMNMELNLEWEELSTEIYQVTYLYLLKFKIFHICSVDIYVLLNRLIRSVLKCRILD